MLRRFFPLAALLCVGMFSACTARVLPPKKVDTPVRVWLLQFPIHPSLVLESEPGTMVMYEFGEWDWFAEQKTHWSRVFTVFLWPTPGSLSRRSVSLADGSGDAITSREVRLAFFADQAWAIDVEQELATQLRQRLEERYAQASATALYRADLDTWFVKDPDHYHALRTCHEAMTAWLRELDCSVRGLLWTLRWRVDGSPDYDERAHDSAE